MTTFSQLVDSVLREIRRPELLEEIATYLNQTLREIHFTPDTGAAVTYRNNLQEITLTATSDDRFSWTIPNSQSFQLLQAVRYDSLFFNDPSERWIRERVPGIGMSGMPRYWYQASDQVFFYGYGGKNALISLAWYEYPRRLRYMSAANRPAQWDEDSGWTYAPAYDIDETTRAAARALVSNWALMRWQDVIAEGLRAKIYKRTSDTERARTCYSLYGSLRAGLFTSESVSVTGHFG